MGGTDSRGISPERFEEMVASIEQALSTEAQVTTRTHVVDRDGIAREVDVLIAFPQGGRTYVVAIECRKRERTSDVTWIDQITGKYATIPSVDKVVAVSESGFSEAALNKAAASGVETLTLSETDTLDWRVHFAARSIAVSRRTVDFHAVEVVTEEPGPTAKGELFDPNAEVFETQTGIRHSLLGLWNGYVVPNVGGELPWTTDPTELPTVVLKCTAQYPLYLLWAGKRYRIQHVAIGATVHVATEDMDLLPPREYRKAGAGEVRGGSMETERPVQVGDKAAHIVFLYEPIVDDPAKRSSIRVVLREEKTEDHDEV